MLSDDGLTPALSVSRANARLASRPAPTRPTIPRAMTVAAKAFTAGQSRRTTSHQASANGPSFSIAASPAAAPVSHGRPRLDAHQARTHRPVMKPLRLPESAAIEIGEW